MKSMVVLFSVFAATMGNAAVFATLGLFGRGLGLSEMAVGAVFASSALLFLLTSSQWGRLSDRLGRTVVMAVGLLGTAASLFLFAGLYTMRWQEGHVAVAFAGLLSARIIYGLVAGGIQPAATAHMADVTADRKRSGGVASVGAAVGIGGIAGSASAAALVGFGLYMPLLAASVVIALAGIAILLGAPEIAPRTTTAGVRPPFDRSLAPHMVLAFALVFAFAALQPTTAFFVQDRFHFGTAAAARHASFAAMSFAACSFFVQVFVIRVLAPAPCALLAAGLAICLAGFAGCLAAPEIRWLIAGYAVLGAGFGLAQSGLAAEVSLGGGDRAQGHAAGRLQAVMSAGWIAGALGGTGIYRFSVTGPLTVGAVALAMGALAFLLAKLFRRHPRSVRAG